jgi:hypothetical protein
MAALGCSSFGVPVEKGNHQVEEQERDEVLDLVLKLQLAAGGVTSKPCVSFLTRIVLTGSWIQEVLHSRPKWKH